MSGHKNPCPASFELTDRSPGERIQCGLGAAHVSDHRATVYSSQRYVLDGCNVEVLHTAKYQWARVAVGAPPHQEGIKP